MIKLKKGLCASLPFKKSGLMPLEFPNTGKTSGATPDFYKGILYLSHTMESARFEHCTYRFETRDVTSNPLLLD